MSAVPIKRGIVSQFQGIAAADKAMNSRELVVYSPELLPFVKGEIKATEQENSIASKSYSGSVQTVNYITATYKDETANRPAPPDVKKGETVILYNEADDKVWYWKSDGRRDELRRTETTRIDASATSEYVPEGGKTDDNSYFIELDSARNKRIRLSTSNVNGEADRYIIDINTGDGTIFVGDGTGNKIFLNTGGNFVGLENAAKSQVQLDGENILIACEGDFRIVAKGAITFECMKDMLVHTMMNMHLMAALNMRHTCTLDLQQTAGMMHRTTAGMDWLHYYGGKGLSTGGVTMNAISHMSLIRR